MRDQTSDIAAKCGQTAPDRGEVRFALDSYRRNSYRHG
jgi:hypothetical protein